MHPIERLRYVARSAGAPQDLLVRETAAALGAFADDPGGLVTACRRVVARQPTAGALWWLCSRMLCAPEPMAAAWEAVEEIDADATSRNLAGLLPADATVLVVGWPAQVGPALVRRGDLEVLVVDAAGEASSFVGQLHHRDVDAVEVPAGGVGAAAGSADLVVLDASAAGQAASVCSAGSRAAAAVARHAGVPVWAVAGVGRVLPDRIWTTIEGLLDDLADPWDLDDEVVPLTLVDQVVGPDGNIPSADLRSRIDTPLAPELFRLELD